MRHRRSTAIDPLRSFGGDRGSGNGDQDFPSTIWTREATPSPDKETRGEVALNALGPAAAWPLAY
jgi:hypothetical protein